MALPTAAIGPSVVAGQSVDSPVVRGAALSPMSGPVVSVPNAAALPQNGGQITVYTVHDGDTLSEIADMFGVSGATITSVNDLPAKPKLHAGETLVILPMSGYQHSVVKGETLGSISKTTGVPAGDIAYANDLDPAAMLSVGTLLVIPDTDFNTAPTISAKAQSLPTQAATPKAFAKMQSTVLTQGDTDITVHPIKDTSKRDIGSALLRPVSIAVGKVSQGAHGWDGSAVDIAAPLGTPIVAAADGVVLLARSEGYNDGYGQYVIVMSTIDGHQVETLYAHMSKILVSSGSTVSRGQQIGLVGKSGDATGYHVHFEVRGAQNPIAVDPNYTGE